MAKRGLWLLFPFAPTTLPLWLQEAVMRTVRRALVCLGLLWCSQGQAAQLAFTYQVGDTLLTAVFNGTIEIDPNLFDATSIASISFGGTSPSHTPLVMSADYAYGFDLPRHGVLSLDGTYVDLMACSNRRCTQGFQFGVGDLMSVFAGRNFYAGSDAFGDAFRRFNPAFYSAVLVPEPSSCLLLLGAVGVACWARARVSALPILTRDETG
ncbi:MAG: hypothetical protein NVSMB18_03250 [Acetobacteraceae bacterium]